MKAVRLASLVLAVIALVPAPAPAETAQVVAWPGAGEGAAPVLGVATAGTPVTFLNTDIAAHTVVAEAAGSEDRPWCAQLARAFGITPCPLFFADVTPSVLALDASGGRALIQGSEGLAGGRVYPFRCVIYPDLEGAIYVL